MTYVAPSIRASGDAWAALKSGGLAGHLEDLLAANATHLTVGAAPTLAATGGGASGGSLAAGTYFATYTLVDAGGETVASAESSQMTVSATNVPRVTFPSLPAGAISRNLYLTPANGASGTEVLYASGITGTTFDLSGAAPASAVTPPTANTTGLTAFQLATVRLAEQGQLQRAWSDAQRLLVSIVEGAPIPIASENQRLLDYAVVFHLLATCLDEAATLVAANPGTISTAVNPASGIPAQVQTLP